MDIPTQYCELGNLQLLNVITSFFFIIFAFLSYRKTKNKFLPILLSLVGISSALWHLTSFAWADLLDTGSIAIFCLATTYLLFSKIFTSKIHVVLSLVVLVLLSFFIEQVSIMNGSLVYIFLFFILLIPGLIYLKKAPIVRRYMVLALVVFGLAIVFRILDPVLCEYVPMGTHFIWHILMALVGYYLILVLYKKTNS